jgi:thiol-disulfide isomerase/thioredoxin
MRKTKLCTKCKKHLPENCFSADNSRTSGLRSHCKPCIQEASKIEYLQSKNNGKYEKTLEKRREWGRNNREIASAGVRRWRENNREKYMRTFHIYAAKNEIRLRKYQKNYREENKENIKSYAVLTAWCRGTTLKPSDLKEGMVQLLIEISLARRTVHLLTKGG